MRTSFVTRLSTTATSSKYKWRDFSGIGRGVTGFVVAFIINSVSFSAEGRVIFSIGFDIETEKGVAE